MKNKLQKTVRILFARTFLLAMTLFLFVPCLALGQELQAHSLIETNSCDCTQAVSLLQQQKKANSHEFRQLKRELALLKETTSKPGLTEILGGIGYIIGLFGLSYYWYARNILKGRL